MGWWEGRQGRAKKSEAVSDISAFDCLGAYSNYPGFSFLFIHHGSVKYFDSLTGVVSAQAFKRRAERGVCGGGGVFAAAVAVAAPNAVTTFEVGGEIVEFCGEGHEEYIAKKLRWLPQKKSFQL